MSYQPIIKLVAQASKKYAHSLQQVQQSWQGICECQEPGLQLKCHDCPYYLEWLSKLQAQLDSNAKYPLPVATPKSEPWADGLKEICCQMFTHHYSCDQICQLTGIKERGVVSNWLQEAGLLRDINACSPSEQKFCLQLYSEGKTTGEISEIMKVTTKSLTKFANKQGVLRGKRKYLPEQKEKALEMYHEDAPFAEIESITGVPKNIVCDWAKRAKVKRKHRTNQGRKPLYSPEFKQQCFDLLASGKKPSQVGEIMGVSPDTIVKWRKQSQGSS